MNKIWHHGIIKYQQKNRVYPPKEIHAEMIATLWAELHLYQQWKNGRLNVRGGVPCKLAGVVTKGYQNSNLKITD